MGQKEIESFVDSLHASVNQKIIPYIEDKNTITILATAAPKIYAQSLKKRYHFDYISATEDTKTPHWKENLKEVKKKNVLHLLQKENLTQKIDMLFTDHHDDLPLMREAELTYLLHPSEGTIKYVKEEKINYQLIKGL